MMWQPFLSLLLCLPAADPAGLEARLAPLARAHKGKVAIAVKNLETGVSYYLNADEPMPTASLIKIAVMIEVFQQADAGKLKLTDTITLRDEDKVPGSGVLTDHFSAGATFPVRDALRLMMGVSDNTATNLLLDRIGIASVNKRMEAWGFPNTKINAKVFRGATTSVAPERTRKFGLGSTTAREMVRLLEELQLGTRNRPAPKQAMLGLLRRNKDRDKFARLLPPGTVIRHKDGATRDTRTDAGLINTPGGVVAVCVLTTKNKDQRWDADNAGNQLCARVARAVYDHFAAPPSKPSR
jgi:beta-lactamase class A